MMIDVPPKPDYPIRAALYFVEGGHYIFRSFEGASRVDADVAKFVRATDVAAAFSGHEEDTGWMPAGVARMGHSSSGPWFVYSAPAQKVDVILGSGDAPVRVPIPRTILIGIGMTYYLYAQTKSHLEAWNNVFLAPFPNVYPDGRICWGRNMPPEAQAEKARNVWELFFEAPFNGDLAGQKCRSYPNDVRELLRIWKGKNKFPNDELITTRETLDYRLSVLIGRRN
jgi:hypothetical protein